MVNILMIYRVSYMSGCWGCKKNLVKKWKKLPTSTGEFTGFLVAINSMAVVWD